MTLAWTEDHYGRAPSAGKNEITSAVRSATARVGGPFAAAREVATRRTRYFSTPAVAAAGGLGPPQTVVVKQLQPGYYRSPPAITVALDPNGTATVLYEEPVAGPSGPVGTRLMAAEGG